MALTPQTRRTILISVSLAAVTLAVFWPVTGHDFISYDDAAYVTENPRVLAGVSWSQVGLALRTTCLGNWHPLTMLSHMLDVHLFGLNAGAHHLTSLLLHTANAVLLFLLFLRITGAAWRSALVAALFAIHPLHVESVAWVAERKDVLSAFFFMLALWAYVRNAECGMRNAECERPSPEARPTAIFHLPSSIFYPLSLLLFLFALASKAMVVTLPVVMLLLDYWPLKRIAGGGVRSAESGVAPGAARFPLPVARLILEKLPFFALAAVFTGMAFFLLRQEGATRELPGVGLGHRLIRIFVCYEQYLAKTIWPAGLALPYPRRAEVPLELALVGAVAVIGFSLVVIRLARQRPYLPVGWFWFLGMLIPVIGIIGVGAQMIADRYTYLPLIGLFVLASWSLGEIASRRRLKLAVVSASIIALAAMLLVTRSQVRHWRNSETLFRHTLAVTEANPLAHALLGGVLAKAGNLEGAGAHYREALRLEPGIRETEICYARVLALQNKFSEAVAILAELLRRNSCDAEAHFSLGDVFCRQGDTGRAIDCYRHALVLKPDLAEARFGLAALFAQQGDTAAAIEEYQQGLRSQPDFPEALNNLAWIRAASASAAFRNGDEAVQLASRACLLTGGRNAVMLGTLAAAYAEAGRFQEAVAMAQKARAQAEQANQPELASRNHVLLELYRAGQPARDSN